MKKAWTPTINLYDPNIRHGDVYILNYYDIWVFFQICDVGIETVKVVELATHKWADGSVTLYHDLRLSRHPYFVRNNVRTKSDFEVFGEDGVIYIPVWPGDRIYEEALLKCDEPVMTGTFLAEKIKEYQGMQFVPEIKEKEIIC